MKLKHIFLFLSACMAFTACVQTDVLMIDPQSSYEPSGHVLLFFTEDQGGEDYLPFAIIEVTSPALGGHSRTQILETLRDKASEIGAHAVYVVTSNQQYIPATYTSNIDGSLLTIPGGYEKNMIGVALRHKDELSGMQEAPKIQAQVNQKLHGGLSFNALAPVLGGYGGSGWMGINNFRTAFGYYQVDIPEAMTRDGFNEGRVENAYRLTFDYFFLGDLVGPYFGSGFQHASYTIGHAGIIERGDWEAVDFILGFGYKYDILPNLHIDTKIALDLALYQEEYIRFGGRRMYPDEAKVYGMVGIGLHF